MKKILLISLIGFMGPIGPIGFIALAQENPFDRAKQLEETGLIKNLGTYQELAEQEKARQAEQQQKKEAGLGTEIADWLGKNVLLPLHDNVFRPIGNYATNAAKKLPGLARNLGTSVKEAFNKYVLYPPYFRKLKPETPPAVSVEEVERQPRAVPEVDTGFIGRYGRAGVIMDQFLRSRAIRACESAILKCSICSGFIKKDPVKDEIEYLNPPVECVECVASAQARYQQCLKSLSTPERELIPPTPEKEPVSPLEICTIPGPFGVRQNVPCNSSSCINNSRCESAAGAIIE